MLEEILNKLEQAVDTDDFDMVQADCMQMLEENGAGAEVVDSLLGLMERHPLSDFGIPGDIAHFMEHCEGYEDKLLASVRRAPTMHTIFLLHRCFNDRRDPRHATYGALAMELLAADTTAPEIRAAIESFGSWA